MSYRRSNICLIILVVAVQLFVFAGLAPASLEDGHDVAELEISPRGEEQDRLIVVSIAPLVSEGEIMGSLVTYDDPSTERPADQWEIYDTENDLIAVGWFDSFGIYRVAVDRGILEEADKPEGVFVLLLDGDSV